jgi:F-type H+-transporting ATPase subunit b
MRWPLTLAVALVTLVVVADPALAAAAHGEPKQEGGLSFLDLQRYDLGIFTLIVFGLLCLILSYTAWPKIREGLAKREADIFNARDEALKAKKEAEDLRAELKAAHAKAQDEIKALLEEARRDAAALRATEKQAGVKDAAAERDRAKREISAAKDAALSEIYETAVGLATNLSAKTLGRSITADDHRKLLDESLAELSAAAKSHA